MMNIEHESIKLLDFGYIKLIETWGSDERIIESARMSTQKGFNGWGGDPCPECKAAGRLALDGLFLDWAAARNAGSCACKGTGETIGDEKLLKFLYDNKHATPFEFAGLVIEVQAPIFVFREWHRHRTQSYNEASARYAPLPALDYIPTVERLMIDASKSNKQAGTVAGSEELTVEKAERFRDELTRVYRYNEQFYKDALGNGVPKELARVHLPVGRYSKMRASTCLRNWLAFMTLRSDKNPAAQYEIRVYANALGTIIAKEFPRTWELFDGASK